MQTILVWPFVILQIATVTAIVMFLRMILHKQLEVGMHRIKGMDQENMKKEVYLNERLEKLNREYAQKIKSAEDQANSLLNMTKESVKKMLDAERIKAKDEAKKVIANALQEKEKVLREVESFVNKKALEFAELILKRVFKDTELAAFKTKITKEVIDLLFASENVRTLLEKHTKAQVVTAEELSKQDKEYILKKTEGFSGRNVTFEFFVDETILSGIVLKIGESTIDGSISWRINKAASQVKEEI